MYNNPLRYTDPTGHECFDVGGKTICSEDDNSNGAWMNKSPYKSGADYYKELLAKYGVIVAGDWSTTLLHIVWQGVKGAADRMYDDYLTYLRETVTYSSPEVGGTYITSSAELYSQLFWGQKWKWDGKAGSDSYYCGRNGTGVTCDSDSVRSDGTPKSEFDAILVAHELGHVFRQHVLLLIQNLKRQGVPGLTQDPYTMAKNLKVDWNKGWKLDARRHASDSMQGEWFADMYAHHTFGLFPSGTEGRIRQNFMESNMSTWIFLLLSASQTH